MTDKTMPAFPTYENNTDGSLYCIGNGMDLRDYFAAKTINSVLLPHPITGQFPQLSDFEACATEAYAMADAMLKAREL